MLMSVCSRLLGRGSMAQDTQNTQSNTQPKRLARAKVRRPEVEAAKTKADRKKTIRNIAVTSFAVLLILSMMVPYLATIVSSLRNATAASQAQNVLNSDNITSDQVDAMYSAGVDELEKTLAQSPNDLETIKNLGNQYMSWAYMMSSYATDEAAPERAAELFTKAQETFDRYLAIESDNDIKVNRAMCDLYRGNIAEAQQALEAVVGEDAECASAWANLGMIYELTNPDAAALAYERAIAADPDDALGAKSYAESRLEALKNASEEATVTEDSEATTDDAAATDAEAPEGAEAQVDETGTSN